jgi:hypothetical protein
VRFGAILSYPYGRVWNTTIKKRLVVTMATFLDTTDTPYYGEAWTNPDTGETLYLVERSFPRSNRMLCLMKDENGFDEYFVFPY